MKFEIETRVLRENHRPDLKRSTKHRHLKLKIAKDRIDDLKRPKSIRISCSKHWTLYGVHGKYQLVPFADVKIEKKGQDCVYNN